MSRTPLVTGQFRKDIKRLKRQGRDLQQLRGIMDALIRGTKLSASNKDHKLIGQWFGRRECHVAPDWLLIYLLKNDEIVFERTGSHAELFE